MISKMLSEITSVITKGTTPTSVGCSFSKNGINYIKSESITSSRTLDKSKYAFISEETHQKLKRSQIKENDILFSMAGMFLGKTGIVQADDVPANTNQAVAIIRIVPEQANYLYVYYYLNQKNIVTWINSLSGQSAQPNINLKQIGEIEIPLPDRIIQDTIVEMLSAIDSRIELNTAINENLESQAYLLLEQMLGTPHDDICTLSDIANINPRYTLPKGSEARYIDMSQLSTTASFPGGWAFRSYNGGMKFKNKDTIIARITPCLENGKTAYIDFLKENEIAFGSTEYIVLSPKDNIPPELLYCIVRYPEFRTYAKVNMNGSSGRQRVSGEIIGKYEIPSFTQKELSEFGAVAEPLFKQITENSLQNRNLSVLRDALLPKLMKGELDVSEVKI